MWHGCSRHQHHRERGKPLTSTKPKYYGFKVKGVEMDALDIIQALDMPFETANAFKYIIRAGKKTEDHKEDIQKAIEYLQRFLGRE